MAVDVLRLHLCWNRFSAEGGAGMNLDPKLNWQRPTGCETSACVQTARDEGFVHVRHSKQPDGPILTFTHEEWSAHIRGILLDAQASDAQP
jgi:hypothetical protein